MKKGFSKILVLAVAVIGLIVPASASAADTYTIDPVHSSLVFRVKHLDIAYVYGRFNQLTGTLTIDENDPAQNAVRASVEAANVDTDNDKRDSHLRSPDFFNIEEHRLVSFESTSFEKTGSDTYRVKGNLTMLGVTRPIEVTAYHTGSGKDPWGGFRTGYETTFTIKRSEFGMDYLLGGVGDEVTIYLAVEAVRQ
ncbi:MAG: YceI family protein [Desulfobacterales bacterium]|jgi:polyisoprenoid-binding protein YceI